MYRIGKPGIFKQWRLNPPYSFSSAHFFQQKPSKTHTNSWSHVLVFHSFLFRKIVNWLCLHACLFEMSKRKEIQIARGYLSIHPSNGDDAWWISGSQKCGFLFRKVTLKSITFTWSNPTSLRQQNYKHLYKVHLIYVGENFRQFLENLSFSLSSVPPTIFEDMIFPGNICVQERERKRESGPGESFLF